LIFWLRKNSDLKKKSVQTQWEALKVPASQENVKNVRGRKKEGAFWTKGFPLF
jgi:hypothetical protein